MKPVCREDINSLTDGEHVLGIQWPLLTHEPTLVCSGRANVGPTTENRLLKSGVEPILD